MGCLKSFLKTGMARERCKAAVICALSLAFLLKSIGGVRAGGVSRQKDMPNGPYKDYNLLLISINNVGTEHMSLYGYNRRTTPNLDKWAGEALVFENAFSQASWTLPVATSLFTSLYPYTHKVMGRYRGNRLSTDIRTLPEIMKASGYKTAAFTGGLDYMKAFGHMRGFDDIAENPAFSRFNVVIPQAVQWLFKNSKNKFFLFIHAYNAHPPFNPPAKFKGVFSAGKGKTVSVDSSTVLRGYRNTNGDYTAAYYVNLAGAKDPASARGEIILRQADIDYLRDLYDETILDVDREVVEFLASLDKSLLNKTIVVIFSEHGEMFAKHGRFGRAGSIRGTLYDDVVHVPLIIRLPYAKGKRLRGLAQIIDIMPTLLEMLGIPSTPGIQGRSLMPLVNRGERVNEFVYAGAKFNLGGSDPVPFYDTVSINESIRSEKWKFIHEVKFANPGKDGPAEVDGENFELYDLEGDPNEQSNLADKLPDETKSLKDRLAEWAYSSRKPALPGQSSMDIPEDVREKAKKHGYW